jgi:signal transduction histidine kinase
MIDGQRAVQHARSALGDDLAERTHDLKAPIAIALALCDGAAERCDAPGLQDDLRRIAVNIRAVREQLDALLDTERVRSSRALHPRPADLGTIVRDASQRFACVAARRRVRVEVHAPDAAPGVVDADRVAVAVRNLVANAVRHAREGGVVRTRLAIGGGRARIEVADDGPGVPEAAREAVFRRFARSGAAGAEGRGSGLGLSIVHDVAHAHGGGVEVGRAPEGGALFTLELPLDHAARPLSVVAAG